MTKRIYIVEDTGTATSYLIKASNQAQALRHVARNTFTVKVTSAVQVGEMMGSGSVIEEANETPDQQ